MWEVYLISRLDGIITASWTIFITFTIILICAIIAHIMNINSYDPCEETSKLVSKMKKVSLCFMIPCFLIGLFVPNKNDALAIMGVGTVVDYVQENKTLQEMPDKCVQALDIWLDDKLNIQNDTIK
jgi:hypothetical protein